MTDVTLAGTAVRLENETIVRVGAAAALLGSAVLHGVVVGEHYAEWALAGSFFLGLQAVETVLAMAVVFMWSRWVALMVALSSAATVVLWVVSRTAGVPVGPASFRQPEAVGVPDLVCCGLELLATALVLPWALGRRTTARSRGHHDPLLPGAGLPTRRTALTASALVLVVLLMSMTGLRAATSDGDVASVTHGGAGGH